MADLGPKAMGYTILPMPFADHFTLHGPVTVRQGEVCLLDLTGRELLRVPYTGDGMAVDASALPAGPYILKCADEQGRVVHQRVIKQ